MPVRFRWGLDAERELVAVLTIGISVSIMPQHSRDCRAGEVGLSVSHFGRSIGEPPHLHLIQRRLDRARRLTLTSDMPLRQLAIACGFSDQGAFLPAAPSPYWENAGSLAS
jgi:transcriptional regulator GlxA family with amidase domain